MPAKTATPILTARFAAALSIAVTVHFDQVRKNTQPADAAVDGRIPYAAHLLSVAALILEAGGTEDEAIAGLFHDALEDQRKRFDEAAIEAQFGRGVRDIVVGCTDRALDETFDAPAPEGAAALDEWRRRKQAYLDHLTSAPEPVLRVSLCDKIHNARSILLDHRQHGDEVYERFTASRQDQLWYYRGLADAFRSRGIVPHLVAELERTVAELEQRGSEPDASQA